MTFRILHGAARTVQPVQQLQLDSLPLMGPDVLGIQRALHCAGPRVPVDDHYGPETDIVVTRFQRKHGLEPDGIVGPQTWTVLKKKSR
ncbi:MAG: peptidoglycan-binding domain-containing protein [Nitrospirota bacterium]